MKILLVGDVHIQTSNIPQINVFINQLHSYVSNNKIDTVIFMGDILHTHEKLHTIPFNTALDMFVKISLISKVFIIVGNHDYINNSQFLTSNHCMNCYKHFNNITVVDKVTEYKNFLLVPYVPDKRFSETIKDRDDLKDKIILCHQLFNNVKMGAIITENVEDNLPDVLTISGHIHDGQKVNNYLYYTGSCMQHAFGETDDKYLLLMTDESINDGDIYFTHFQYNIYKVFLELQKKKIIYFDNVNELENYDFSKLKQTYDYKFVLHGYIEEFNAFKKTSLYKKMGVLVKKIIYKHKKERKGKEIDNIKDKNKDNSFAYTFINLINMEKERIGEYKWNFMKETCKSIGVDI